MSLISGVRDVFLRDRLDHVVDGDLENFGGSARKTGRNENRKREENERSEYQTALHSATQLALFSLKSRFTQRFFLLCSRSQKPQRNCRPVLPSIPANPYCR